MAGSSPFSKCIVIGLVMSTVCVAEDAQVADEVLYEMQLKLSKAYSECAAYYEAAASETDDASRIDSEDADAMKRDAQFRAAAHVADVKGAADALQILNADLGRARKYLADLEESDVDAFTDEMKRFRTSCRMAINDPPIFVERTLRDTSRNRRYIQLNRELTLESILKHAKPVTEPMDIFKCKRPAIAHTMSLDDLLVEGGMICTQEIDGVCGGERSWMSYPQYIESQYPDSELTGYSEKLSITFKDGKSQQVRTLTACVTAPQFRT